MAKRPLSGRERDRLVRMKKSAPAKKVVRKPAPSKEEAPKAEKKEEEKKVAPTTPKEVPSPPKEEQKVDAKSPPPKPAAEKKEEEPAQEEKKLAPKTYSAIQKEGAAETPVKEDQSKGETKSSVMAEQTENQGHHGSEDHERDTSHLVENVSTKPLRYALIATAGLVLVIFLSQKYGPSHEHGHSEAAKTEEAMPDEMNEEAVPVMEEAETSTEAEAASPAEEMTPAEDQATPAGDSETSDETTSSVDSEEVAETASPSSSGMLQKPIWGLATAAVKSKAEAQQRVARLKAKGFDANYIYLPDYIPNGLQFYRVFIGPYSNESGARQAQKSYDQSDAYIFSIK